MPFCYLAGAFAMSPVSEEASGAHHLQLLSGCPATMYWAGSYVRSPPATVFNHHQEVLRCP